VARLLWRTVVEITEDDLFGRLLRRERFAIEPAAFVRFAERALKERLGGVDGTFGDSPWRGIARGAPRLLFEVDVGQRRRKTGGLAGGDRVRVPVLVVEADDVLAVDRQLRLTGDLLLDEPARARHRVDEIDIVAAFTPHATSRCAARRGYAARCAASATTGAGGCRARCTVRSPNGTTRRVRAWRMDHPTAVVARKPDGAHIGERGPGTIG